MNQQADDDFSMAEYIKKANRSIEINRALLFQPLNNDNAYHVNAVLHKKQTVEAPLGLGYIAGYAKKHVANLQVEIYDAHVEAIKYIRVNKRVDINEIWENIRTKIETFQPQIVGISCLFFTLSKTVHRMCELVKSVSPSIITVMGGNYPSSMPKVVLEDGNVDFVITSEGEISFSQLVQCLREGGEPSETISGIGYKAGVVQSIGARSAKGQAEEEREEIVLIQKNNFLPLDHFPWPDRTILDNEFYATGMRHFVNRVEDLDDVRLATMTASRGCPFSCTFCASKNFWGNRMRYRDPESVVDEMQHLIDTYDINTFAFNDDNLSCDAKSLIALCNEMVRRNLKIRWFASGGLQVSGFRKREVIDAVIESGLRQFNLAIETGNPKTASMIKKPLRPEITEEVLSILREYHQVWLYGFFITGFYFETIEDIQWNLQYAGNLDLDWRGFYSFAPIPGTEDYESCVTKGFIADFASISKDYAGDAIMLSTDKFTSDQVLHMNYQANLEYNFVKNRNLEENPRQAIREFNHVLETYTDHAVAYYARSVAERNLGKKEESLQSLLTCQKLVNESDVLSKSKFQSNIQIVDAQVRWRDFFKHMNVDIEQKISEVTQPKRGRG